MLFYRLNLKQLCCAVFGSIDICGSVLFLRDVFFIVSDGQLYIQ